MSDTKHTPGPWFSPVVPMDVTKGYMGYGIGDGSCHIAVAALTKCLSEDESRANARLIAAAPELYEACQEALDYVCDDCLPNGDPHPTGAALSQKLRAALAKAERKTP